MASDYILEIDGIKGESQDKALKDHVEVQSFDWGVTQEGTFARGAGGGAGKCHFSDISFTTVANKSSPLLMFACASGKHIKKAVLHVRKAGENPQEYYKITFSDVLVSGYQSSGASGGDSTPMDSFSINFAKIEYGYKPQKKDGTLDTEIPVSWNLKENSR